MSSKQFEANAWIKKEKEKPKNSWRKNDDGRNRNKNEFTEARQHFQEFGKYCNATPNSNPSIQLMKFWKEEAKRSIYGYNIGREWISGYNYFYWN